MALKDKIKAKMKNEIKAMPKPIAMVSLSEKDIKAVKDWDVGQTYELTMKVKMVSKSQGDDYMFSEESKDAKKVNGRFEILSVKEENYD